ncbi:MAG: type I restriction endonuclease [Candidatus Manganitrophus sp.]|nr:MAG: type I restriction endonuclease [Candidatus Manganitrophus sp.]
MGATASTGPTPICSTRRIAGQQAAESDAANRFSVTRQLRYSRDETQRALDLGLFINGLPVATFELKNSLTKQTVADAVEQYQRDRDPRERLFEFGRCVVHFAVDDARGALLHAPEGQGLVVPALQPGLERRRRQPAEPERPQDRLPVAAHPQPRGPDRHPGELRPGRRDQGRTDRPQEEALQICPRFHQLDVVRRLLADARTHGAGRRYLIQHSAGSGKSNSIAWLAHQLIGLKKDDAAVFDSIIVVTDRRILDQQIQDTIKQFAQVGATVGHAEHSGDLRRFIAEGKKIIISTVQKFPFILDEIGAEPRGRRFALIIDEAHSSQGGKASGAMNEALADAEDEINDVLERRMQARKMLTNASYFAFTATPKHKTLEIFGEADPQPDGTVKHRPFHSYTMKQAIQERFILDVLEHYTPVESYYKLIKKVEDDPEFDTKRAKKKLRRYVESHDHAIRLKAEIMVDHFHEQVLALNKIGGEARAMVVTSGIERAIQYFHAMRDYLAERKSRYQAIVAFSGEHTYGGAKVTEASLNGFASSQIADKIQQDPYRFLICADKFQTGYDEPLLHTMYVDKPLAGIKAVQTLSRLNRAHPKKHDVFVLDFMNDADTIQQAFAGLLPHDDPRRRDRPQQAARPQGGARWLPGLCRGAGGRVCGAVSGRRRPRPARPDPRRLCGRLPRAAGRGRAGGLQGQGQGVPARLWLSVVDPAVHERRMGEAVDLPHLSRAQAAGAGGGGPVQGHSGRHRHGQLPRRETGSGEDSAAGRGCGNRPDANRWRRAQAGTGAGSALEHPEDLQRPVRSAIS